jgi:hypothetical protein
VWALKVRHGLEVLLPLRVLLIVDQEERDQHRGGGGKIALTQGGVSYVCHLVDGIIKLTVDNKSHPQHHGVKGYLHPDLIDVQAMGLKQTAMVQGGRPVIAEADECIPKHSWEPGVVLAHGTKTHVLSKGVVGKVIHVHL